MRTQHGRDMRGVAALLDSLSSAMPLRLQGAPRGRYAAQRFRQRLRFARQCALMLDKGGRHGADALENLTRGLGIGNLESIRLVNGHNQLQGVHRIQAQAAGAKQRLVVADFFRTDLEHEVLHHQSFDVLLERGCSIHYKITLFTLRGGF